MSSPQAAPRGRRALAGAARRALLDALLATTRIETINEEAFATAPPRGRPVVFALWHGRLLPPTWLHRGQAS
jgi:lysophospholipid acyltransferase (LPLAT)-like uncharacterized protein